MLANRWRAFGLALVLCAVLPPLLGRAGVLTDFRASTITRGAGFAIAALGLNLLLGYSGKISLGHFALAGAGAYTSAILTAPDRLGLAWVWGALSAVAVGAMLAFLVGLPALRLRGLYLAIATMAFAFAMEESILQLRVISKGSAGLELPRPIIGAFEFSRDADYLALALVMLVLVWLIDSNVTHSKLGRAFQAIRANETVAASFGVDVRRYKLIAFTISGAFAGLAGSVFAHQVQFVNNSTFAFDRSLLLVIIVVIGGLGSRVGVVVSAGFYAVFPVIFTEAFGNDWAGIDLIVGAALLMYTVSRHPGGLAEAVREARERKERKARERAGPLDVDEDVPALPDLPRPASLPARAAERSGAPLLSAREISVSFGGVRAVDRMSLDVHRGRIVGLIGPNGAGKTTLFNVISGAIDPEHGMVELLGHDVSDAPAHVRSALGMGRSFQLVGLSPELSVTENLLLAQHLLAGYGTGRALAGLGRAARVERELEDRAREAIAALGFVEFGDRPVKNLSGGQRRIVEIACVLMTAPELLLLDEPSAGMAPAAVEQLAVRLGDLRDELGRTVLLIEHNIPLVLDVCDEVYVMAQGGLLAHGTPAEIVGRDDVVAAYLGTAA